jgi:hypothetical protein
MVVGLGYELAWDGHIALACAITCPIGRRKSAIALLIWFGCEA